MCRLFRLDQRPAGEEAREVVLDEQQALALLVDVEVEEVEVVELARAHGLVGTGVLRALHPRLNATVFLHHTAHDVEGGREAAAAELVLDLGGPQAGLLPPRLQDDAMPLLLLRAEPCVALDGPVGLHRGRGLALGRELRPVDPPVDRPVGHAVCASRLGHPLGLGGLEDGRPLSRRVAAPTRGTLGTGATLVLLHDDLHEERMLAAPGASGSVRDFALDSQWRE